MDSRRQQKPRLERRNAAKNIDYEASTLDGMSWLSSSSPAPCESTDLRVTRSLDICSSSYSNQTSFRIDGSIEGEVDLICRSLGLSGPDDFAIPVTAWEARKARSSSDLLPRSRALLSGSTSSQDPTCALIAYSDITATIHEEAVRQNVEEKTSPRKNVEVEEEDLEFRRTPKSEAKVSNCEPVEVSCNSPRKGGGERGIKGVRPPVLATPPAISNLSPPPSRYPSILAPPPSISLPPVDRMSSTWDILKSFCTEGEENGFDVEGGRKSFDSREDEEEGTDLVEEVVEGQELKALMLGEISEGFTGTSSLSTMNDDDASSTTTEVTFVVSPNGRFKRSIKSWMRGVRLGSGSFGVVYEGISDEGVFFAVKEVSLVDQGSNAQQCILQLEQEVLLLSQFEHENIVQYYGTDKEEANLFIFLELVTQGSLASLYQKYPLRESQVAAYTRQILNGLVYLHERNVVHRDIKCANILVHANGSVKLADFGLAKEITKINVLKSCKGSVYWMAPEVVQPKRTYGPAADIWSLGCTVLEMITHQLPYPGLEWTQAFFKIGRGEQPPIPKSLSKDARDFISQCVQVSPDDRPTASQLLEHPFVMRSLRSSSGSDSSSHGIDRWN
ncbi:mitogen-activated protein kinase kinase kinase 1-like [Typha angustifolia]|uniref:mitogen-activated protein kinase kinase kinase 1-like n=1 Tax=Typha angustifolia TaxID=59011 RepID=UPI003C30624D